jgi:hypothetical protein
MSRTHITLEVFIAFLLDVHGFLAAASALLSVKHENG